MKKILCFLSLFTLNCAAWAISQNQPAYQPGGSVGAITLYDALSPMTNLNGAGWWYFVGLTHDQQNAAHSLQVMILNTQFLGTNYGIGALGFTFKNASGQTLYLWNLYPDINSLIHYPIAPLQYTNADQNNYQLQIQSDNTSNTFLYQFAHDTNDVAHHVGEIGATYNLAASGYAEIGAAQNQLQLVQYQLSMRIEDQRGFVPEGDDGYVGSSNAPASQFKQNSWEMTMPSLKILQWTMTISPTNSNTPNPLLTQSVTFQNNQPTDTLWLDRQMLDKPTSVTELVQNKINQSAMSNIQTEPLYRGTWMAFCLNRAPFKHVCGDAVAFWKSGVATDSMDSDTTALAGFFNLFTPDSGENGLPKQTGNTLTENLFINGDTKLLPYRIVNSADGVFTSPLTGHVYAQVINLTVRSHTLFSAYLNTLDHDHHGKYVLRFVGLSKQTENVMLNNQNGYYEGAARVLLCDADDCKPVGTGFVEQMGY